MKYGDKSPSPKASAARSDFSPLGGRPNRKMSSNKPPPLDTVGDEASEQKKFSRRKPMSDKPMIKTVYPPIGGGRSTGIGQRRHRGSRIDEESGPARAGRVLPSVERLRNRSRSNVESMESSYSEGRRTGIMRSTMYQSTRTVDESKKMNAQPEGMNYNLKLYNSPGSKAIKSRTSGVLRLVPHPCAGSDENRWKKYTGDLGFEAEAEIPPEYLDEDFDAQLRALDNLPGTNFGGGPPPAPPPRVKSRREGQEERAHQAGIRLPPPVPRSRKEDRVEPIDEDMNNSPPPIPRRVARDKAAKSADKYQIAANDGLQMKKSIKKSESTFSSGRVKIRRRKKQSNEF